MLTTSEIPNNSVKIQVLKLENPNSIIKQVVCLASRRNTSNRTLSSNLIFKIRQLCFKHSILSFEGSDTLKQAFDFLNP